MIKSMTGFGRGEYSDGKRNVTCEIKTVNHRYADINVKMPKRYSFAEEKIKTTSKVWATFLDRIAHNGKSIGEVQTKDAEPERFKSVANEAQCDN